METTVQLRKKGQVVIPEPVRIALNLADGDILQIDVEIWQTCERDSMTATMHKCHSIIITGKVQDIGFRNTVEHIGRSFGLPGIVFNSNDGSVKILCSGEENVIETFTQEIRMRGVQSGAEISGIEEQTLSVHIDLPEGFTKVSFDDEIDIGRKLDKANIFLKTGFESLNTRFENLNTDLNTGFDSMNRNLNTGFNEIKIGINNLSTIMLEQNIRFDEHNIRLEAMQKEHNEGQREHNTRLEAILEKLASKSWAQKDIKSTTRVN